MARDSAPTASTPFLPIAGVTFLASMGTGVLWNGIGFIAKSTFAYGPVANFSLLFAFGVAYVLVAANAGRVIRTFEDRLSARTVLAFVFLAQALIAPIVLFRTEWSMWLAGCGVSALSALQWPIIEAYIAGGRDQANMRSTIGRWNVTWMSAVWLGVAGLGPLLTGERALGAILLLAPLNVGCAILLRWFRAVPGEHLEEHHGTAPTAYPPLLASVRMLLPLGYVVASAISAIVPFLVERVGATPAWVTPLAATWLATRLVAVVLLWTTRGWHGRWTPLVVAGLLCPLGFAIAVFAPTPFLVGLGLGLFGLGQGAIYYMAIYYAMAVGKAEVDAAGTHEALIGLGYAVGPLVGIASYGLTATERNGDIAFVASMLVLLALGSIPAITPYRAWRRSQRAASPAADR